MHPDYSRYSCQITLPEFGELTQERLQQARVLIVGAGGLGCPAAQYIAAAGVGTLGIADHDVISVSNLHRQILYKASEVGEQKAAIACKVLQEQNHDIIIVNHTVKVSTNNVVDLIQQYDIVLDCTDNFATRYLLNDACVLAGMPLIHGAIYQYEGHVAVWNTLNEDGTRTPNYRDLFPNVNAAQVPNCTEGGVFPTLAGIIGTMMANETIKYITRAGTLLTGKMLVFDALAMQSRIIKTGTVTKTQINQLPDFSDIKTISHQDLKKNIEQYLLVDVRTFAEHETSNIGGVHIPLNEIASIEPFLKEHQNIVVYCTSGRRSEEAARLIKLQFNTSVYSLEGGIKRWR